MSYPNRKFAHCIMSWTVDACCRSPYHENFNIESSVINIAVGGIFTRWRMALRHRIRTSRTDGRRSEVHFEIKRLCCEGGLKNYTHGEYVLTLHNGQIEREMAYGLFSLKISGIHSCRIQYMELIDPLPSATVELKVHLVFRFDGVTESLPECSNPYVKQLSKDLNKLYASMSNGYDIMFQTGRYFRHFLHKGILLNRLKREDLKQRIREASSISLGLRSHREAWEKMFKFLYTADMNLSAHKPTSDVYDVAVSYAVGPIIAYYEPDYLELHTRTEYEDLEFTWTITDPLSRIEESFISRRIDGEVGYGIMRLDKSTRGDFLINCDIGLEAERYVCVELFLKSGESEILVVKDHARPWGGDVIGISKKVSILNFGDIRNGGSVTLKLLVRMSCIECEADRKRLKHPSIGVSRIVRKPYCNEQNYIELSDDLMSLYRSSKYFNVNISSPVAMYTNEGEDYILRFRNKRIADILFSASGCHQGVFEPHVVRAVLQFVFCAKLGDAVGIEDSFKLIAIAKECSFDSLGDALIDNLKKLLTNDNANLIYSLAESHNMLEFMAYMRSQEDLPDLCCVT